MLWVERKKEVGRKLAFLNTEKIESILDVEKSAYYPRYAYPSFRPSVRVYYLISH
jgi:hypothetical protein